MAVVINEMDVSPQLPAPATPSGAQGGQDGNGLDLKKLEKLLRTEARRKSRLSAY